MAHMGYKNFREPVVYILDQELRKRNFKNKINTQEEQPYVGQLPEYPCRLVRSETTKKVVKIIYAEGTELEWSETLIRNTEGRVYRVKTIYPNKSEKVIQLNKNGEQQVVSITYVEE